MGPTFGDIHRLRGCVDQGRKVDWLVLIREEYCCISTLFNRHD